jgi:hypothetical protein
MFQQGGIAYNTGLDDGIGCVFTPTKTNRPSVARELIAD